MIMSVPTKTYGTRLPAPIHPDRRTARNHTARRDTCPMGLIRTGAARWYDDPPAANEPPTRTTAAPARAAVGEGES